MMIFHPNTLKRESTLFLKCTEYFQCGGCRWLCNKRHWLGYSQYWYDYWVDYWVIIGKGKGKGKGKGQGKGKGKG